MNGRRAPVRIGITMGDPAGVGPELCLRALREPALLRRCAPVVFGDAPVLRRAAERAGLPPPERVTPLAEWQGGGGEAGGRAAGALVVDCGAADAEAVTPGKADAAGGRAAAAYIEAAVRAALDRRVAGIATAPINKEALHMAGIPYPGHTEMLAAMTGARRFCMMMASRALRVSLATVHAAIAEVPSLLTRARIVEVIELTAEAMRRLGRARPVIAVCGLNPHAGEHGLFGREEADVVEPAVAEARSRGAEAVGPLPADTAFLPGRRREVDAYVVMYHDQGLIPFKALCFDKGVNVTLGLPIVRTSVDHGTAYDIAWTGQASPVSLFESVKWALRLARGFPEHAG
jgi:4-hydroxythreonine-4-phosphate dehydrogenase